MIKREEYKKVYEMLRPVRQFVYRDLYRKYPCPDKDQVQDLVHDLMKRFGDKEVFQMIRYMCTEPDYHDRMFDKALIYRPKWSNRNQYWIFDDYVEILIER